MNLISLELPASLYRTMHEMAEKEHVSINQFISLAVAEKISALMTEEYLGERAKRGSKAKFEAAMAKVADVEPEAQDKL